MSGVVSEPDVFTKYYLDNTWANDESRSGPGSTISYTHGIREGIRVFCRTWKIQTFFDSPCGDFNWMQFVEFPANMRYIGGEIVKPLVDELNGRYASPSRRFIHFDITQSPFPDADVWFCRDCLMHLSYRDMLSALENFCASGIRYLFTSSHVSVSRSPFVNGDTYTGDCRPIDLFAAPFNLPHPEFFWPDYVHPFQVREMVVWNRQQIAEKLPGLKAAILG